MYAVPKPSKNRKESRPSRDEFELQELADQLGQAKEEQRRLYFTIWRMQEGVLGTVVKMDAGTQRVHIQTRDDGVLKVPFIDILGIDNTE